MLKLTYSGSRYPGVPATTVDTCVPPSVGKLLERPKSASFAWKFSVNKIFPFLISLCTITGLHPLWRYSSPTLNLYYHNTFKTKLYWSEFQCSPCAVSNAISSLLSQFKAFPLISSIYIHIHTIVFLIIWWNDTIMIIILWQKVHLKDGILNLHWPCTHR